MLWWLETRPESKAVVMGPTQRQVEEIVWQEMREAYGASEGRLIGRMFRSAYRIDEQRFALGFSTNNALNIQGFHAEQLLVVVTEAHAMPQLHMDAVKRLQPNRLLLVGNALSRDGEFYASHHAKRNLYHRIAISAFDTPNFTGEDGGTAGDDHAGIRGGVLGSTTAKDHPLYAASVLAEFPDALEDSLVGRDAVESAMERWEAEQPSPQRIEDAPPLPEGEGSQTRRRSCWRQEPRPLPPWGCEHFRLRGNDDDHLSPGERSARGSAADEGDPVDKRSPRDVSTPPSVSLNMTASDEPVYIGVDVARFGFDRSVICVRQGERVLSMRSFDRMDTMRLVYEVLGTVRESAAEAVFVDEGGVGGGVVDRLRELGAPVYGVHFGGGAQRPTRFFNRRSEIFWELRRLFDQRLIAIPRDEELAGQMLGLRYDVSSSGQVRLEGKREMRQRGMPSPDKADALALAFLVPPSFGIWTGAEPLLRDDDPPKPHLAAYGYDHPPPFSEEAAPEDDSGALPSRLQVWW